MPQDPAVIWERAEPADFPSRPRVLLNMLLGVIVGLGFGIGLAFFIEYLDTSVKTLQDLEKILQVPVLAVIPKDISLLIKGSDDNPDAEAYRIMRTNIEFNRKSPAASSITIVSGGAGEGKSTTLNNLAYTFAKGGYLTLVVDADLRRPSQHRLFGVENKFGLSDCLTKQMDLEEVIQTTKLENLYFLPSGQLPRDAVGILNSQRMLDFIQDVKSRFDIVFFDAFGPRAQGEMWEIEILEKMHRLLVPGGVFVTYCAKGQLKRDLRSLGFKVESLPGPPGKREMTRGVKGRLDI
jgi:Mrp family chromosome partitioning ATPase